MRIWATMSALAIVALGCRAGRASEPALTLTRAEISHQFGANALLTRRDTASVSIPQDISYRRTMTYRAVPLLALLGNIADSRFDTLEAHALDGFIAQIPLALIARGAHGGAVAWLAVEDPTQPWASLPHESHSAGPFYIVWENPERSGVRSEQWPHGLVSLSFVESPLHRWPQLELPPSHASDEAARSGQKVFLSMCLPCHRLKGGGASDVGPDLGQPMGVTEYLTETGLREIIRNPRAVRSWPNQQMSGFGQKTLPDTDLGNLLVYLRVMTGRKPSNN